MKASAPAATATTVSATAAPISVPPVVTVTLIGAPLPFLTTRNSSPSLTHWLPSASAAANTGTRPESARTCGVSVERAMLPPYGGKGAGGEPAPKPLSARARDLRVLPLVAVLEADLAVQLHGVGSPSLGERLREEEALARDLEQHRRALLQGGERDGVRRHEPVHHDRERTEVGLDDGQVDAADGARGLAVVRVGQERLREPALLVRADDGDPRLALLQAAVIIGELHGVVDVLEHDVRELGEIGRASVGK